MKGQQLQLIAPRWREPLVQSGLAQASPGQLTDHGAETGALLPGQNPGHAHHIVIELQGGSHLMRAHQASM
jgi:hypothetical protein